MVNRSNLLLAGLFAAGGAAVLLYTYATQGPPGAPTAGVVIERVAVPSASAPSQEASSSADGNEAQGVGEPAPAAAAAAGAAAAGAGAKPETIEKWVNDANGENAEARVTAIAGLAGAPKNEAVPALAKVLEGGDPQTERPLALRSLRTIAFRQGDADGRIREVIRQAIYHADGDGITQEAQAVLEDIEQNAPRSPND